MLIFCMYYFYSRLLKMYRNVSSTARVQVSKGYITSFKKLLSCFYFKKQLLEDYQLLHMLSLWAPIRKFSTLAFKLFMKERSSLCTLTES